MGGKHAARHFKKLWIVNIEVKICCVYNMWYVSTYLN